MISHNAKLNILHLTLKKGWFDMIASGEKKEEYREIKPYWTNRFKKYITKQKDVDIVVFKNGYSKHAPVIKFICHGIEIGTGNYEWGAEIDKKYYVIKLGLEISEI